MWATISEHRPLGTFRTHTPMLSLSPCATVLLQFPKLGKNKDGCLVKEIKSKMFCSSRYCPPPNLVRPQVLSILSSGCGGTCPLHTDTTPKSPPLALPSPFWPSSPCQKHRGGVSGLWSGGRLIWHAHEFINGRLGIFCISKICLPHCSFEGLTVGSPGLLGTCFGK